MFKEEHVLKQLCNNPFDNYLDNAHTTPNIPNTPNHSLYTRSLKAPGMSNHTPPLLYNTPPYISTDYTKAHPYLSISADEEYEESAEEEVSKPAQQEEVFTPPATTPKMKKLKKSPKVNQPNQPTAIKKKQKKLYKSGQPKKFAPNPEEFLSNFPPRPTAPRQSVYNECFQPYAQNSCRLDQCQSPCAGGCYTCSPYQKSMLKNPCNELLAPPVSQSLSPPSNQTLTGIWQDTEGQQTFIRQVGNYITGLNITTQNHYIFGGTLIKNSISGTWAAVPYDNNTDLNNINFLWEVSPDGNSILWPDGEFGYAHSITRI